MTQAQTQPVQDPAQPATQPVAPPHTDESRPDPRRLRYLIGAGIGVAALLLYLFIDGRIARSQLAQQKGDNYELHSKVENLESRLADIDTAGLYREQLQAIARDDAFKALQVGKPVEEKISQLRQELIAWKTQEPNFLTGDAGRRIAADPKLVEQAHALLNVELPPEDLPNQLKVRLDGYLAVYRQALERKSTEFKLTQATINGVLALGKETDALRDLVNRVSRGLETLATRGPATTPANTQTLQAALAVLDRQYVQERNEEIRAALAKARVEGATLRAKAEADAKLKTDAAEAQAKRLVGEQQAGEIIAAAEAKKRELDRIRKETEDKEKKLTLERDFAKEETRIRTVLNLFIAGGEGERVRIDKKRGAASLLAMQANNALEDSEEGVAGLIGFIARTYRPKDQTLAFVGGYGITAKQRQMASSIQALLRKYGQLLVEKNLLEP